MTQTPPTRREIVALALALAAMLVAALSVATRPSDVRPVALPSPVSSETVTPSPAPMPTRSPSPRPTPTHRATPRPVPVPVHRGIRPNLPPDALADVAISARVEPAPVVTVALATLRVDLTQRWGTMVEVAWDDGATATHMAIDCPFTNAPPSTPPVTRYQDSFTHQYRYPGVYYVVVRVRHQCEGPRGANQRAVRVRVRPGPDVGNGPARPASASDTVDVIGPNPDTDVTFAVGDADGCVTEVVVDWGDGSAPLRQTFGRGGCLARAWQWPQSALTFTLPHRFVRAARQITLSLTSTGRDGRDVQHATARLRVWRANA